MKDELGRITIYVDVDVIEDEVGELTIDGGSKPSLRVNIDLPGNDPTGLALSYLRKVADSLDAQ